MPPHCYWCEHWKRKYFSCNSPSAERSQKLPSQTDSVNKGPGARTEREGSHPRSNQYQRSSDVSNSKKLQRGHSREFSSVVSQPPKTKADIVITLPLSQPCWAPWLLLSLQFHSKYTDHCTRLRKHALCILAGGIYSESAADLLYLVFDGCGSRGNKDSMAEGRDKVMWQQPLFKRIIKLLKFKMSVDWYECGRSVIMSPRSSQLIPTSQQAAAVPLLRPDGARAFQQRDARTSVEAAAGWTTWEWKLILFTFNLPFPPLQNLERAKSCNTRIKSKCSRNGPTGSRQQEALAAWPRRPAARSNRYAQFSNTYSQITITRIWTPSSSRKNKGADFLCPCEFERVFVCLSASTHLSLC